MRGQSRRVNMYYKINSTIIKCETEHRWEDAIELLYSKWNEDRNNLNNLLCAGLEIWIVLVSVNRIDELSNIDEEKFMNELMELASYGSQYFKENAIFLLFFGYMIKVMPYLFLDYKGNYDEWRKKGHNMMISACKLRPSDMVFKALYYSTVNNSKIYRAALDKIQNDMTVYFSGDSAVDRYFRSILAL